MATSDRRLPQLPGPSGPLLDLMLYAVDPAGAVDPPDPAIYANAEGQSVRTTVRDILGATPRRPLTSLDQPTGPLTQLVIAAVDPAGATPLPDPNAPSDASGKAVQVTVGAILAATPRRPLTSLDPPVGPLADLLIAAVDPAGATPLPDPNAPSDASGKAVRVTVRSILESLPRRPVTSLDPPVGPLADLVIAAVDPAGATPVPDPDAPSGPDGKAVRVTVRSILESLPRRPVTSLDPPTGPLANLILAAVDPAGATPHLDPDAPSGPDGKAVRVTAEQLRDGLVAWVNPLHESRSYLRWAQVPDDLGVGGRIDIEAMRVGNSPLLRIAAILDDILTSELAIMQEAVYVAPNLLTEYIRSFGNLRCQGILRFDMTYHSPPHTADDLGATTHNWNPGASYLIRVATQGNNPATITGMAAGLPGEVRLICHIGSAGTITLTHDDGGSSAENRWANPGGSPATITPGQTRRVWYDSVSNRWRT